MQKKRLANKEENKTNTLLYIDNRKTRYNTCNEKQVKRCCGFLTLQKESQMSQREISEVPS